MQRTAHIGPWIARFALTGSIASFLGFMLGCGAHTRQRNESVQLDLRKLGPFPEQLTFSPIQTYSELPKKVREHIGYLSNPNGLFNPSDVSTPGIPNRRMIFAYGSDHYCLLSYEKGGIGHEFIVVLFEVFNDQAVARWAHSGKRIGSIGEFRQRLDQGSSLENEVNEIYP